MNSVGIDISNGKSMVAIMRPFGEIVSAPFEIKHTNSAINPKLIKDFDNDSLRKVKSNKADAVKIVRFLCGLPNLPDVVE